MMLKFDRTNKIRLIALLFAAILFGEIARSSYAAKLVDLPRDLEIQLALSALPEDLRDKATVYVLNPAQGYEVFRQGTNGFVTFVGRSSTRFYQADWPYDYPPDQLIPVSYDSVGVEHHLSPWFDIAKMRAQRVGPEKVREIIQARYRDGTYSAPKKGGISYMLAPIHRAYSEPEISAKSDTFSFPHHMPYAPHISGQQLGNHNPMNGGPHALNHGGDDTGPHGYMVFMIPGPKANHIRATYAPMLNQLCSLHMNWCLKPKK